ncbi:sugar 3,4-ketoisomerase [Leptospira ilyithenensis]|uniref:WxcM-like domain-containing protein n=1 Tax=Leptospira ilyithenensis TaxID=2484901 RepID=A0A4V3JWR6_9LEPT|nr:FdtA/QdtA family cupin domain-containing protein [Leptospira ilyithenensis]TGN08018.1 WxcM-like domain-containing protein [Leptospira ilyithenensis]
MTKHNLDLSIIKEINFQDHKDDRGRLTSVEYGKNIPFEIKRTFLVHQVVSGGTRGRHAHTDTDQVLTVVHGSYDLFISNGSESRTFVVNDPSIGIYIPAMFWIRMSNFKDDAVCLVYASTIYDMKKSIRTWEEYLSALGMDYRAEDI